MQGPVILWSIQRWHVEWHSTQNIDPQTTLNLCHLSVTIISWTMAQLSHIFLRNPDHGMF